MSEAFQEHSRQIIDSVLVGGCLRKAGGSQELGTGVVEGSFLGWMREASLG